MGGVGQGTLYCVSTWSAVLNIFDFSQMCVMGIECGVEI